MNLRLILRIARTELAVLFYSPVAWLLLVAFTCQVGFDFMNILNFHQALSNYFIHHQ